MPMAETIEDGTDRRTDRAALVIARRRKGRPVADDVGHVCETLAAAGVRAEPRIVRRKRELRRATRQAVAEGSYLIVCVGGDGAVREVATALLGTPVALAVIPAGTGNLFARGLGIPHDRDQAIAAAISGRRRSIDCGVVKVDGRKRVFNVACGIGFDAQVMRRTANASKRRWGVLAYAASAVREARAIRERRHKITLDGRTFRVMAAEVIVANVGRVPPGLAVEGVEPDDGVLDVFVVRARGPLDALSAVWEVLRGAVGPTGKGRRVIRARAKRVAIDVRPPRAVELDGSDVGRTPVRIKVRPAALHVMVPRP